MKAILLGGAVLVMPTLLTAAPPPPPQTHRPSACGQSDMAHMAPAELLDKLDQFRASLAAADHSRLDRLLPRAANGGIAQCDRAKGSRAVCEAHAYMPALRKTGLMSRFQATICPHRRP